MPGERCGVVGRGAERGGAGLLPWRRRVDGVEPPATSYAVAHRRVARPIARSVMVSEPNLAVPPRGRAAGSWDMRSQADDTLESGSFLLSAATATGLKPLTVRWMASPARV